MKMSLCPIDIFEFLDYREFLRSYYQNRKADNLNFSFQFMGLKLGMDASALAKVFMGQRQLPAAKIAPFAQLLGLRGKAAEYFEAMVLFGRAKNDQESKHLYEAMLRLRAVKKYTLASDQYRFYSKWHYTAIRAMLGLGEWRDEWAQMGKQLDPPLRPAQVESAVTFLCDAGLVKRDAQGILRATERHIRSGPVADRQAVRNFQKEMLGMAKRSIDEHDPGLRDISTLTIAMEQGTIADVRALVAECREAIRKRIEQDTEPNVIYQVNFQVFPLTRSSP